MKVTILVGCSGSGKSTWTSKHRADAVVCSADHFFTVGSHYRFDPSKLGQAHGACLRNYTDQLLRHNSNIVVDNTNTTVGEVAPYVALALAYGYDCEILYVAVNKTENAISRNVHDVPAHVIEAQVAGINEFLFGDAYPSHWPQWSYA